LAGAFEQADRVIVTDIYASREAPDPTIDSARVVAALDHGQASQIGSLQAAATQVLTELTPGTVVITLSAGDGNEVARLVWQGWQASEGGKNDG
jgi:UDP-N-acetylmuramate--alanine ligase